MNGDPLDELDEQGAEIKRLLAENERLRQAIRRLADQDATLSVCDGNVTVTMDATLTDAEREAIATAATDQQPRTKEAANMSETNERSVASAGSVDAVNTEAADRMEEMRMTDAEREAALLLIYCGKQSGDPVDKQAAATLRGFLKRLGGEQ